MRKLLFATLAAAALMGAAAGSATAQPVVVERYGHWDPAWGAAPPPPMHRWHRWRGHEAEWYGHVHTCMVHKGYDPHRDMYREGHRWVSCAD
jgi:opacity protein-like surface antigen